MPHPNAIRPIPQESSAPPVGSERQRLVDYLALLVVRSHRRRHGTAAESDHQPVRSSKQTDP
jgi:hypothetical protein